MPDTVFHTPSPFVTTTRSVHVPVIPVEDKALKGWLKKQSAAVKKQAEAERFAARAGKVLIVRNDKGEAKEIHVHTFDDIKLYDMAVAAEEIGRNFSDAFLKKASFEIKATGVDKDALARAHIGWALGCYKFSPYKKKEKAEIPALVIAAKADKKRIKAFTESIYILRNLINTPSNDMGPAEMAKVARKIAANFKAKINVVSGAALKKDFPLVHMVGDSSARKPCLIDITWGNPKHPKVTLVGKGVVFDTGGNDIKPAQYMALMKKDMGGGAHALAVGRTIMALGLPVRLRVIVPAVENAVSDTAFRPGDIVQSRKGIQVENTNTDAEGRLVLADALTLASEEKPDLIIDFATLTGSARAALGQEVPAMFSNNDKLAQRLQKISMDIEDPLWQMPLWHPYKRLIKSETGDLVNSAKQPGDLIYSALFLESFLVGKPDWIHLDLFAWESSGRPGRPVGGMDMSLRAVVALIEDRYKRKKR